jgi:hypothetical protein
MSNLNYYLIISTFFLMNSIFGQSYSDGFKKGYEAGYCHNQPYGCRAPYIIPDQPKPGKNSYQDGYNDGFIKGQAAKTLNSTNSQNPGIVDFNQALNKGVEQAQQRKSQELDIQLKRLELEQERLEMIEYWKEERKKQELKISISPELDLGNGNFERYKFKIPKKSNTNKPGKYYVTLFDPITWGIKYYEEDSSLYSVRKYSDETVLHTMFFYSFSSPSGQIYIDSLFTVASKEPKTELGIHGQLIDSSFLIKSVVNFGTGYCAGLKKGDLITKIDKKPIKDTVNLLAGKFPGDTINVELIRNNSKYLTTIILEEIEARHYGKFTVSNYPSFFETYVHQKEEYGLIEKELVFKNIIAVENDIFVMLYIVSPDNENVNFESEFKRFQKLVKKHLNSISISLQ